MQQLANAAVLAFQRGDFKAGKHLNQLFGALRQHRKAMLCIKHPQRKVRQDFYRWRASRDI